MSDYSGEFAYNIGLPSKSGIQGAMMIIIPGKMGVFVYSPLLDNSSNSVRGV
jgi:glutaminase